MKLKLSKSKPITEWEKEAKEENYERRLKAG